MRSRTWHGGGQEKIPRIRCTKDAESQNWVWWKSALAECGVCAIAPRLKQLVGFFNVLRGRKKRFWLVFRANKGVQMAGAVPATHAHVQAPAGDLAHLLFDRAAAVGGVIECQRLCGLAWQAKSAQKRGLSRTHCVHSARKARGTCTFCALQIPTRCTGLEKVLWHLEALDEPRATDDGNKDNAAHH